eukprot:1201078-Prorocentrum_lima.AAC.1
MELAGKAHILPTSQARGVSSCGSLHQPCHSKWQMVEVGVAGERHRGFAPNRRCLLYTSDAADDM